MTTRAGLGRRHRRLEVLGEHCGELLVATGLIFAQAHVGQRRRLLAVASFDHHPTADANAGVLVSLGEQLPAPPLRPHLDIGRVLDQLGVLGLAGAISPTQVQG